MGKTNLFAFHSFIDIPGMFFGQASACDKQHFITLKIKIDIY